MQNTFKQTLANYIPELIGIMICLIISFVSGMMTSTSDFAWYANLNKPSFNPPNYIFAPVWTILYILMGWCLGRLFKARKQQPQLLIWFLIQLFFNAIWSYLFFQAHSIFFAMLDLIALWLSLSMLMVLLKKRKVDLIFTSQHCDELSFFLLSPYWLWVSFAMILNISLFFLNK